MKKKLVLLLIASLPMFGYSQFLSLNELITLSNSDDDYFDTYATKKGYTFYNHGENEIANSVSYTFLKNGIRKGYLSKYTYNDKEGGWVELQTTNSDFYLKIKDALKVNGFLFYDKGVIAESNWMGYKKGNISVRVYSSSEYNEFTRENSPVYNISVENGAFKY
jgi:hypothetical protein